MPAPAHRRALGIPAPVLILCLFAAIVGCGTESDAVPPDEPEPSAPAGPDPNDLQRELAAAHYTEEHYDRAVAALAPLVASPDASVDDLVSAAIAQWALAHSSQSQSAQEELDEAWNIIERAHERAPDDPRVAFTRGNMLLGHHFDPERAAEEFRLTVAAHPEDAASRLQLGEALLQLGDVDGAREQFEAVRAIGVEHTAGFHATATYKLGQLLVRAGEVDRGRALLVDEKQALSDAGIEAVSAREIERGPLGRLPLPAPAPIPPGPATTTTWPTYEVAATVPLPHGDIVLAADIDYDGDTDLLGYDTVGVSLAMQEEGETFTVHGSTGPDRVHHAALGDLDNDGPLELVTIMSPGDEQPLIGLGWKLDESGTRWTSWGGTLPTQQAGPVTLCDFDHDGDLDALLATASQGVTILRNDGLGVFVDATPNSAAAVGASIEVLPEDIDGDNDVDLIVRGATGVSLLSNLRGGRFVNATKGWNAPPSRGPIAAADLDGDGRIDLVTRGRQGLVCHRFDGERFVEAGAAADPSENPLGFQLTDVDRDGRLDLLTFGPQGASVRAGPLAGRDEPGPLHSLGVSGGAVVAADVLASGDTSNEIVVATDAGVEILRATGSDGGGAFTLHLEGFKDNLMGAGSIVEVRAGMDYQRIYWRGGRAVVGLGSRASADIVRVTWPNGVTQHLFDVAAGSDAKLVQVDRLAGSCPFLYTWNGETYTFVSDVLGATPLGLPMAPGQLVPFDHEEYVKVRGDQLVASEGRLRLAVTEELREVTYLDRVRLHAIDHPRDVEIQPDEAFAFPPFPPHHVHTFTTAFAPARAVAGPDGRVETVDVTDLVEEADDRCARPFTVIDGQFLGLCEPWSLELSFGRTEDERRAIVDAPRLRLALTGWLQWGDASVNMAAARHPEIDFVPPRLWVPDGKGWRAVDPPIGFPAGKTKTMVVDVTDILVREDPRVRLTTTLELSWDATRLVVDDDDAPWRETVLDADVADLAFRGFSELIETGREDMPELFDWSRRTERAPWNQHPGMYTRYGAVRQLLDDVDDRYVIMGAGDVVYLEFDAEALPVLPDGWTRDYLVYFDGWAKDGDPNTVAAETVEPLPFHGMSSYPPPPGESFPDDAMHRAWKREWNTRPHRRLIPSLVPAVADDTSMAGSAESSPREY